MCFDACHAAVALRGPAEALDALADAGHPGRQGQLSRRAAIAGPPTRAAAAAVRRPDLPAPGHAAQRDGSLQPYPDLPEALAAVDGGGEEWRIHFHVPIFVERYGDVRVDPGRTCARVELRASGVTPHLEIETYTWDVLPADLKASSVDRSRASTSGCSMSSG